jgi:hypothetical protein
MRAFRALSAATVATLFIVVGGCSSSNSGGSASDTGHPGDGYVGDTGGGGTDTYAGDTVVHDTGSPFDTRRDSAPGDTSGCASRHPGDECDMVAQNCADKTQTCDYDPTAGHSVCTSRTLGTGTKGDACPHGPTDCDAGLFCYEGHCTPACCTGDNSVCGSAGGIPGSCNLDITQSADAGDTVIYNVCTYSKTCHPFSCDCDSGSICLFDTAPDSFTCDPPSSAGALSAKPGISCKYENDCGEGQGCFGPTGGPYKCMLFCLLAGADGGTVSPCAAPKFGANGTCTVGGTSYGTCTDASGAGIGGGLGLCEP